MFDPELEQFVTKMEKSDTPMAKADLYATMKKFSNRQRTATQSEQQAFVAFIERDPHGRQLYQKYKQTRGVSVPAPEPAVAGNGPSASLTRLRAIAARLKAENPELSTQQSLYKALQTDDGRAAYLEDKRERLRVG